MCLIFDALETAAEAEIAAELKYFEAALNLDTFDAMELVAPKPNSD